MLIDFHTHAFPEKVAPKAMQVLAYNANGIPPQTDGTLESLRKEMQADGVKISVVNCIATNAHQMHNVNNFALEVDKDPDFVCFGSVHPDAPDALEELERLHEAGIKGIKFHPEYQKFDADDEKMKPIYKKISELGFVTTFHAGLDIGFPPPYHSMPPQILGAVKWLDTPVVAAHWGSMGQADRVIHTLGGIEHVYMDTSWGYGIITRAEALALIEAQGVDHVLFASDMPWHRPAWEMKVIKTLDLTAEEEAMICHKNAEMLLKIV